MSADADVEFVVRSERMFGHALREFRHESGATQAELADRIDVHRTYLSALENGKSSPAMRALVRAYRELGLEVVVRPAKA